MIFIDIVDYIEPTMLIVGSRGLGNLKGYVKMSDYSMVNYMP